MSASSPGPFGRLFSSLSRRRLLFLAGSTALGASTAFGQTKPATKAPKQDVPPKETKPVISLEETESAWVDVAGADQREFPLNDPNITEIAGYTEQLSYEPGNTVRLFVHTTAPTYDIEIIRDGLNPRKVWSRSGLKGLRQNTPENAYAVGCGWRDPVAFQLDSGWQSGFYLIVLRATGADGRSVEREAGFVLRAKPVQRKNSAVLILTTVTATAYNDWGGANSYRSIVDGKSTETLSPRLSLQRPWARGFLRLPINAPRHSDTPDLPTNASPYYPFVDWALAHGYSRHYGDGGWAYYERPFVCWAEQNGYQLDYVTQHDLQLRPDCISGYACAVIVGHDEYWSWEMRDTIENFTRKGGNVMRLGGNFIWQVRLEDEGRTQVCYKTLPDPISAVSPTRTTVAWDFKIINRPGAATFGLTGFGGIYVRLGATTPRAPGGYTVYRPNHWAFEGTDLYYGDMFGAEPSRILAFEVDGVDYTFRNGLPYPTYKDGAPQSLEILAMAPAVRGEPMPPRHGNFRMNPMTDIPAKSVWPIFYDIPEECLEYGAAMMSVMTSGSGQVFNSGCCNWVTGLLREDKMVMTITKNVLDRFTRVGGGSKPRAG